MMKKHLLFLGLLSVIFISCDKLENELEPVVLNNPYDEASGVILMSIDSVQRNYGTLPNLKCFFHIDTATTSLSLVQRVILYRDGNEKARLSPGNFSFFVDITAQPGGTYNYQLSMIMKDSSYTKMTPPYLVTF